MSVNRILDECVVLRINKLRRRLTREQDVALRPLGITGQQLALLARLSTIQQTTAKVVCDEFFVEKSTMSRNLKRLLKLELIVLAPPAGRHGRKLSITDKGKLVVEKAFPVWLACQQRIRASMGQSERDALELLDVA